MIKCQIIGHRAGRGADSVLLWKNNSLLYLQEKQRVSACIPTPVPRVDKLIDLIKQ